MKARSVNPSAATQLTLVYPIPNDKSCGESQNRLRECKKTGRGHLEHLLFNSNCW